MSDSPAPRASLALMEARLRERLQPEQLALADDSAAHAGHAGAREGGHYRLRIVSADAALGRGTGVALGKNIGRRFYVEIITDGRGYSATQLEFRVTSWLSLLGSISTVGRESVLVKASRDY